MFGLTKIALCRMHDAAPGTAYAQGLRRVQGLAPYCASVVTRGRVRIPQPLAMRMANEPYRAVECSPRLPLQP